MNINETMRELAQYTRLQEEAAEMVEALKDTIKIKHRSRKNKNRLKSYCKSFV